MIADPAFTTTIIFESLYPKSAIELCIEGEVTIRYKVSENHTATDIKIVKSEPSGIFDEPTIKSMKHYYDKDVLATIKEKSISWNLEDCKIQNNKH